MIEDEDKLSDLPMSEAEEELKGSTNVTSLQVGRRIVIPEEWVEDLSWEKGDDILMVHEGDGLRLIENSIENLRELLE